MVNTGLLVAATAVVASLSSATAHVSNVRQNMGADRVLSINHGELTVEAHDLLRSHDADHFGGDNVQVDFKVAPETVSALESMGIDFKDSTEKWLEHFEQNLNDPALFCHEGDEACAARDMQAFYSNYQSFEAIISRAESLVSASSFANMISIGESYEGRDMKLVEVGDQTKPMAFIFCNIHAREWLAPMFCSHLIETLLADGGHPILDTFSFGIVPSANPDGYTHSRTNDNLWRKTRKPNSGSNCVGTDGNRNWNDNHCGVGSSTNPCSQTYCGTAPFDQIEVANLNNYAAANSDRLVVMLDIHSYGSYLLYPYGYTTETPPAVDYDRMRQCSEEAADAARAVDGVNWRSGTTPQLLGYTSGGTSKDYFYNEFGVVYPYTVELRGSSFQPSSSNIVTSNAEAFELVIGMMECVKKTDFDGESPSAPPVDGPVPTPFPTVPPTAPPTCFFFC